MKITDWATFAEWLNGLGLKENVRICINFKNIDDTDRDESCAIVRVAFYKMPQVHKLIADSCFLHTEWFNGLSKGIKIIILQNSNIKLFLKHPEHL